MLNAFKRNVSLTQLKNLWTKYKLLIVVASGLLVVVLVMLAIMFLPQKPIPAPPFVPTLGSPKIAQEARISFITEAPVVVGQPAAIVLSRQSSTITESDVEITTVEFGFPKQPTRVVGQLKVWSNKNESLSINLGSGKMTYRKNIYTQPQLLEGVGFGDEQSVVNAASAFVQKYLVPSQFLNLNSPEVEYFHNRAGIYLTPQPANKANTALVTYHYLTLEKARLITAGGVVLSVTAQVVQGGTVIGLDTYLGNFVIQPSGATKNFNPGVLIEGLQKQPIVIRALAAGERSEATTPNYADLKQITINKIYTAYYFQQFQPGPQNGTLVVVGEGEASTTDNRELRVWLAAAL